MRLELGEDRHEVLEVAGVVIVEGVPHRGGKEKQWVFLQGSSVVHMEQGGADLPCFPAFNFGGAYGAHSILTGADTSESSADGLPVGGVAD